MSVVLIGLRFIHLPKHIWNPLIIEFNIEIEIRDRNKWTAIKIKIKKLLNYMISRVHICLGRCMNLNPISTTLIGYS